MSPIVGFARNLPNHPACLQNFSFEYVWLEAPLGTREDGLDACLNRIEDVPNWQDPVVWPAGRVFGLVGEYRWQSEGDATLHAVLLLEDGLLPGEFESGVPLRQEGESHLILWGEWVDPEKDRQTNPTGRALFYANEIPRVQIYPINVMSPPKDDQTPRIVIRRYRAIKEDVGGFVRCLSFGMKGRESEE